MSNALGELRQHPPRPQEKVEHHDAESLRVLDMAPEKHPVLVADGFQL